MKRISEEIHPFYTFYANIISPMSRVWIYHFLSPYPTDATYHFRYDWPCKMHDKRHTLTDVNSSNRLPEWFMWPFDLMMNMTNQLMLFCLNHQSTTNRIYFPSCIQYGWLTLIPYICFSSSSGKLDDLEDLVQIPNLFNHAMGYLITETSSRRSHIADIKTMSKE